MAKMTKLDYNLLAIAFFSLLGAVKCGGVVVL